MNNQGKFKFDCPAPLRTKLDSKIYRIHFGVLDLDMQFKPQSTNCRRHNMRFSFEKVLNWHIFILCHVNLSPGEMKKILKINLEQGHNSVEYYENVSNV